MKDYKAPDHSKILDSASGLSSVNSDITRHTDGDPSKINSVYTAIALFKCVVGTGSFFLPKGVQQAGLYGGFFGLIIMGIAAIYLNWIIMDAKWKTFGNRPVSYNHLCEHLFGPWAGRAMYISIVVTNAGSCSVYLVTIAGILINLSCALSIYAYMALFLLAELLVGIFINLFSLIYFKAVYPFNYSLNFSNQFSAFLPSFKYLSWTSILGDCALALAIGR